MSFVEQIREKARAIPMRIVLPEGDEPRTVQAAAILQKEKIANPILLGNPSAVYATASATGTDLSGIPVIFPAESPLLPVYAN